MPSSGSHPLPPAGPNRRREILVVDDGSLDATAVEAERHGAVVVQGAGPGQGRRGDELAHERRGDYVVFLDGGVEKFAPHFVSGLLGPLLCREGDGCSSKGSYARPLGDRPNEGGRVTELVANRAYSLSRARRHRPAARR